MTVRPILQMIREDDLAHDPWGTAMAWHFAIADAMTEWAPPYPPAEWGYRQAMSGVDRDSPQYQELSAMLDTGEIDPNDLLTAGRILNRFERLCQRAGVDY